MHINNIEEDILKRKKVEYNFLFFIKTIDMFNFEIQGK